MNHSAQFKEYLLNQTNPASKATVKNYISDLNRFLTWFEAKFNKNFSPSETSYETIESFKSESLASYSASSVERNISSLRKFFSFLKEEGKISQSPFEAKTINKQELQNDPWKIRDFKNYLYLLNASTLTIKNYIIDINQFKAWTENTFSTLPLSQSQSSIVVNNLDSRLVNNYKNRLLNEMHLSPSSVNRKLSSIRKYISWASEQGIINNSIEVPNEIKPENTILPQPAILIEEESIGDKPSYSRFPPMRLAQKSVKGASYLFDGLIIAPIALVLNKIDHAIWTAKGKPVFEGETSRKITTAIINPLSNSAQPVRNIPKSFYAPTHISLEQMPLHKKTWHIVRHNRPNWYIKYHSYPLASYINLAALLVVVILFGYITTLRLTPETKNGAVLASTATTPPRVLSFQGRITDKSGGAVNKTTALRMAIYNNEKSTGSALLWQEVVSATPDQDGIFNVLLGKNTPIPSTLFAQNSALWLGVTVETTTELTPRQPIATVAFASNAETLDGLLPITISGDTKNVVLALNSSGNLTIGGSANPTFQATGGTFTLSGKAVAITTTIGSNGNITLAPNGNGIIDIQKVIKNTSNNGAIAPGSVQIDDTLALNGSTTSQAVLILAQASTGDLIAASASGITKFKVDNGGNITAGGSFNGLSVSSGTITSGTWNGAQIASTYGGTGINTSSSTGVPYVSSGVWSIDSGALAANHGGTGYTTYTQGDILFGNSSNNLSTLGIGSAGNCLISNGSTPTWSACSTPASDNIWGEAFGAIFPNTISDDFLLGASTTSSAKFAVLNVNQPRGNQTASISGGLTLDSDSANIQTTSFQALTIGGDSTGKIQLRSGSNNNTVLIGDGFTQTNGQAEFLNSGGLDNIYVSNTDLAGGNGLYLDLISNSGGGNGININWINNDDGLSDSLYGELIGITNNATTADDNIYGLYIDNLNSGSNDSNQVADAMIGLDNSDSDNPVPVGIRFLSGGGGGFTNFIDTPSSVFQVSGAGLTTVTGLSLNSGAITLGGSTGTGQCITGGTNASWGSCGNNYWQLNDGVISPFSNTLDLAVGGTSTTTAKFAFLNNAGGTPVASISANSGSNNTYLSGNGYLGTTNKQSLTIGNSTLFNTTGNTYINPNQTGRLAIGTTNVDSTNAMSIGGAEGDLLRLIPNGESINDDAYVTFNARGRFGYDGTNQAVILSDANANKPILFMTSGPNNISMERFRIGAGLTQPGASISGATSFASLVVDNSGVGDIFTASKSGATKFTITNSGAIFANSLTNTNQANTVCYNTSTKEITYNTGSGCTSSSARFKHDIAPLNDSLALLMRLKPVEFRYNSDYQSGDRLHVGFIAEEVNQIDSRLVDLSSDGVTPSGVQYANITALLTQGIQQQQLQITNFQARLSSLESNQIITNTGDLNLASTADESFEIYRGKTKIDQVGAFSNLFVAKLKGGYFELGRLTVNTANIAFAQIENLSVNSLAIASDNFTIAGQNIKDYIYSIVDERIGQKQIAIASPILETDMIKPSGNTLAIKLPTTDKNSKVEVQNASGSAVASIDASGNASFSGTINSSELQTNDASIGGTLRAGRIIADSLDLSPEALNRLQNSIGTNSGTINNYYNSPTPIASTGTGSANLASVVADNGTFTNGLISFGQTSFFDASIANRLFVGAQLSISDQSINVLGANLKIQPLSQGGVDFLAGKIVIDTDGNLKVNGNADFAKNVDIQGKLSAGIIAPIPGKGLVFEFDESNQKNSNIEFRTGTGSAVLSFNNKGDINASGSGTFSKINLSFIPKAIAVSDTEIIATGSAGTAEIKPYQNELTIKNPSITKDSLIYITPKTGLPNQSVYLLRQAPGESFTVGISKVLSKAVPFNWIIIN